MLRLATSVASVFDGYVVYRSEWLKRWGKGEETHWQADLWRRVVERLGPHDLASRIDRALSMLRSERAVEGIRFKRFHLFSLETLPPLFLEFFSVLSQAIPTAFYLLEPSSEYVSDVDATSQLSLPIGEGPGDGHPLLSNLGRLARDFQQLLLAVDEAVHHEDDLFEAAPPQAPAQLAAGGRPRLPRAPRRTVHAKRSMRWITRSRSTCAPARCARFRFFTTSFEGPSRMTHPFALKTSS